MLHWFVTDEPPAASEQAPAAEPAPLSPIEHVAEIFEQLFLKEAELTADTAPGRAASRRCARRLAKSPRFRG
jgi:hypothetical protein